MAKIICDSLENHPTYKPVDQYVDLLKKFQMLTDEEVSKIMAKMASKSCEINSIPTTLLKEVLPSVTGPITSIVNNSITTGIFAQS